MTLKLIGIGGMGLMLSPSAKHLQAGGPANFLRIHDRGTRDGRRDACREAWKAHGAAIATDYETLIGDGDFDGVVICAGKNGDDCEIFRSILPRIREKNGHPFVLHLSTVSAGFARAAHAVLQAQEMDYVNYPLTGGPLGAETANMLILASGSREVYSRLEPMLQTIGNPEFFGTGVTAGAEVKLIGQLMVFNGLVGICSAAALKSECFREALSGSGQAGFFDFLNGGAGGTRQWDVALSKGVREGTWDQGFMIQHAVVDAIYAADLCRSRGLPALATIPMAAIALAFAHVLTKYEGTPLSTHAIVREMIRENAADLDGFINDRLHYNDMATSIQNAIDVLPEKVKASVRLDISEDDFQ